jgi:branched-chain amino acid transport system ATP-binding protein
MLELSEVDAGYDGFQALFGVSLEVNAGEAVAVIGPNGAGKTTLMRVCSGLIRPTGGTIRLAGTDLGAVPAHRIVELGIAHVPENRRLFAKMSVEDNLRMGAYMRRAQNSASASVLSMSCSRASRSAAPSSPGRCRAASSRCARSAAR